MVTKGIYSKENVIDGVYILTANKKFVGPKFWGIHEEEEKAECVAIVNDEKVLCFYPYDINDEDTVLLDWEKKQTEKIYYSVNEALQDDKGYQNTISLANAGSEIAKKVLSIDLLGFKWYIPTLNELNTGYKNKTMLSVSLAISDKKPLRELSYWTSTRRGEKCNRTFDWGRGYASLGDQYSYSWLRPVCTFSLTS